MVLVNDVLEAVAVICSNALPEVKDVMTERVQLADEPQVSIEIISFDQELLDYAGVNKTLVLNIIYLSEGNKVSQALLAAERLAAALLPGLWVGSRHLTPSAAPNTTLVEQDLHFRYQLSWHDDLVDLTYNPESGALEERKRPADNDEMMSELNLS